MKGTRLQALFPKRHDDDTHRAHRRAHLIQVRVSGDVVAPLLGTDSALLARPGVADTHSLERGPGGRHATGGVTGGAGEDPHAARRHAPETQRHRGSSRERVHAACGQQYADSRSRSAAGTTTIPTSSGVPWAFSEVLHSPTRINLPLITVIMMPYALDQWFSNGGPRTPGGT